MRELEEFDGTKGKVAKQWFTKAFLWATVQLPNYNNSEPAIMMRLLLLMKLSKAADWAQPHLARLIAQDANAFHTLRDFTKAFDHTFSDPDTAHHTVRQLETLKQDGTVADYNTSFDNLHSDLE